MRGHLLLEFRTLAIVGICLHKSKLKHLSNAQFQQRLANEIPFVLVECINVELVDWNALDKVCCEHLVRAEFGIYIGNKVALLA